MAVRYTRLVRLELNPTDLRTLFRQAAEHAAGRRDGPYARLYGGETVVEFHLDMLGLTRADRRPNAEIAEPSGENAEKGEPNGGEPTTDNG